MFKSVSRMKAGIVLSCSRQSGTKCSRRRRWVGLSTESGERTSVFSLLPSPAGLATADNDVGVAAPGAAGGVLGVDCAPTGEGASANRITIRATGVSLLIAHTLPRT